jgi:hypothetical protein
VKVFINLKFGRLHLKMSIWQYIYLHQQRIESIVPTGHGNAQSSTWDYWDDATNWRQCVYGARMSQMGMITVMLMMNTYRWSKKPFTLRWMVWFEHQAKLKD